MAAKQPLIRPVSRAVLVTLGVAVTALLAGGPSVTAATGAGLTAAAPQPATAGSSSAPQLSIAVDDGHTATRAGDTLDYTITVRNLGTTDVAGLDVTQSVPSVLKLDSTAPAGARNVDGVDWNTDLKLSGAATFHSTATVLATPPDLFRLAVVACARTSTTGPAIVCAADSDQLPAGAAEAAGQVATHSAGTPVNLAWWYVTGGVGLLAIALAIQAARRRRTRQHD